MDKETVKDEGGSQLTPGMDKDVPKASLRDSEGSQPADWKARKSGT